MVHALRHPNSSAEGFPEGPRLPDARSNDWANGSCGGLPTFVAIPHPGNPVAIGADRGGSERVPECGSSSIGGTDAFRRCESGEGGICRSTQPLANGQGLFSLR